MTAYILPIDKPDAIYTIHIRRFNPETDNEPYWASYSVPHTETMTVVEALEYLWDQGEYIAFRTNCREFTCGSCAMLINGKPRLACDTILKDGMRLEPLSRYPVLRDLVVYNNEIKNKLKNLKYWPITGDRNREYTVSKKVLVDYSKIYSRCIECSCCLEACPASFNEASKYAGPMYMLLLGRVSQHPVDSIDRVKQASENGMGACVSCFECADACPMNLNPAKEVTKLRRKAVIDGLFKPFRKKADRYGKT